MSQSPVDALGRRPEESSGGHESRRPLVVRILRRASGSVVTWRRAQIVLVAAQGMTPRRIGEVVFTDPDTVREVIHYFNRDGFDALHSRYKGGPAAYVHAAQASGDQADRAD